MRPVLRIDVVKRTHRFVDLRSGSHDGNMMRATEK